MIILHYSGQVQEHLHLFVNRERKSSIWIGSELWEMASWTLYRWNCDPSKGVWFCSVLQRFPECKYADLLSCASELHLPTALFMPAGKEFTICPHHAKFFSHWGNPFSRVVLNDFSNYPVLPETSAQSLHLSIQVFNKTSRWKAFFFSLAFWDPLLKETLSCKTECFGQFPLVQGAWIVITG